MIETEDAGHTVRMSNLFTVPYSNEFWRYLADLGGRIPYTEKVEPYGFPTESWEWVEREPYGVVGAIIPWNLPLHDGHVEDRRRRSSPATRSS